MRVTWETVHARFADGAWRTGGEMAVLMLPDTEAKDAIRCLNTKNKGRPSRQPREVQVLRGATYLVVRAVGHLMEYGYVERRFRSGIDTVEIEYRVLQESERLTAERRPHVLRRCAVS